MSGYDLKLPPARTARGFRIFGVMKDYDGQTWTVTESSLAFEGAHCRINTSELCADFPGDNTGWHKHDAPRERHMPPMPHLSVEQAEHLAKLLMQFVAEARASELSEREEP